MIYQIATSLSEVLKLTISAREKFPNYDVFVEVISDKDWKGRMNTIVLEKPDSYKGITILFRLDNDNRQLYVHDMNEFLV